MMCGRGGLGPDGVQYAVLAPPAVGFQAGRGAAGGMLPVSYALVFGGISNVDDFLV